MGLSTFNRTVQIASARRIFGSEQKAKAYFHSRRQAILGEEKSALVGVTPLLVPKYDEGEEESKTRVELDQNSKGGANDSTRHSTPLPAPALSAPHH